MTEQDLVSTLRAHGIDPGNFGRKKAKTISDLLQEIVAGETTLVEKGGQLIRHVRVISANVFADLAGCRLRLNEDRQEFSDGWVRERELGSVSEKLLPGEEVDAAIERALAEEIGVTKFSPITPVSFSRVGPKESPSYPGLLSEYATYFVDLLIDESQYRPEGYKEIQGNKTTFFSWVKA